MIAAHSQSNKCLQIMCCQRVKWQLHTPPRRCLKEISSVCQDKHIARALENAMATLQDVALRVLLKKVARVSFKSVAASAKHTSSPSKSIVLTNGVHIPRVAFGTGCCGMDEFRKYTASDMKAQARMKVALDQGVRFFDTAMQ